MSMTRSVAPSAGSAEAPEAFNTIGFEQRGDVARVTLDRPQVLNAISLEMRQELCTVIDHVRRSTARVLLLGANGERAFSAGADIKEFREHRGPAEERAERLRFDPWKALAQLEIPTVAAIHGLTLGGGAELALACDLRLAATSAQLGFPEVGIGIIPGAGGTQRLPRLIGRTRALELIFTGRRIDADEAERLGIVNRVVPDDELAGEAERLCGQLAERPPLAVRAAKEAVDRGLELPLDDAIGHEIDLMLFLFSSEDHQEAAAAFAEKRAPMFRGR
jgi:enoyl-CoA hydratase/carnithine racemase